MRQVVGGVPTSKVKVSLPHLEGRPQRGVDVREALREPLGPLGPRRRPRRTAQPRISPPLLVGAVALLLCGGASLALAARAVRTAPAVQTAAVTSTMPAQVLLGHRRMAEAPASELVPLSDGSPVLLRRAAASAFRGMQAAAAADGVVLVAWSGFRSVEEQRALFFDTAAERAQSVRQRARVSAPPGYSEHHTGYAVDVATTGELELLTEAFEHTEACRWLKAHANRFSFELSFPRSRSADIAYEPWHYRFTGDAHSKATFSCAQIAQ
jgi:D-alanyl-D-alanine carboxypeptidase